MGLKVEGVVDRAVDREETATGLYRFYENTGFSADILAGARGWSASTDVDLSIAGVVAASGGTERTWIDPVADLRLRANLGNGFGLSAYGDNGAGGYVFDTALSGPIMGVSYRF